VGASGFTSGLTVACGLVGTGFVLADVPLLASAAHDTCLAGSGAEHELHKNFYNIAQNNGLSWMARTV